MGSRERRPSEYAVSKQRGLGRVGSAPLHVEHHSNHGADAWSIQMSDEDEPAPCAPVSENEDDDAGSDAEQASMAQKRRKTGVTKCEDEYADEALSAKANTGKFLGLRVEKPVKPNSAKKSKYRWKDLTAKHSGKVAAFGKQKDLTKCSNAWCRSIINRVRKVMGDATPYF